MKKWRIVIASVAALLLAAMVVVVLRNHRQPLPSPELPAAPAEVRVRAIEAKSGTGKPVDAVVASAAVAIGRGDQADKGSGGYWNSDGWQRGFTNVAPSASRCSAA